MKTILRTLIAVLLLSTGLAWASADEAPELVPAPTSEIEQPQLEEKTEAQDLTLEALLAMDPDKMDAGACCMAECYEERSACWDACGWPGPPGCRDQCTAAFQACKSNC